MAILPGAFADNEKELALRQSGHRTSFARCVDRRLEGESVCLKKGRLAIQSGKVWNIHPVQKRTAN